MMPYTSFLQQGRNHLKKNTTLLPLPDHFLPNETKDVVCNEAQETASSPLLHALMDRFREEYFSGPDSAVAVIDQIYNTISEEGGLFVVQFPESNDDSSSTHQHKKWHRLSQTKARQWIVMAFQEQQIPSGRMKTKQPPSSLVVTEGGALTGSIFSVTTDNPTPVRINEIYQQEPASKNSSKRAAGPSEKQRDQDDSPSTKRRKLNVDGSPDATGERERPLIPGETGRAGEPEASLSPKNPKESKLSLMSKLAWNLVRGMDGIFVEELRGRWYEVPADLAQARILLALQGGKDLEAEIKDISPQILRDSPSVHDDDPGFRNPETQKNRDHHQSGEQTEFVIKKWAFLPNSFRPGRMDVVVSNKPGMKYCLDLDYSQEGIRARIEAGVQTYSRSPSYRKCTLMADSVIASVGAYGGRFVLDTSKPESTVSGKTAQGGKPKPNWVQILCRAGRRAIVRQAFADRLKGVWNTSQKSPNAGLQISEEHTACNPGTSTATAENFNIALMNPLPWGFKPGKRDVICSPQGPLISSEHPGNVAFCAVCEALQGRYVAANASKTDEVVHWMLENIRIKGGNFFNQQCPDQQLHKVASLFAKEIMYNSTAEYSGNAQSMVPSDSVAVSVDESYKIVTKGSTHKHRMVKNQQEPLLGGSLQQHACQELSNISILQQKNPAKDATSKLTKWQEPKHFHVICKYLTDGTPSIETNSKHHGNKEFLRLMVPWQRLLIKADSVAEKHTLVQTALIHINKLGWHFLLNCAAGEHGQDAGYCSLPVADIQPVVSRVLGYDQGSKATHLLTLQDDSKKANDQICPPSRPSISANFLKKASAANTKQCKAKAHDQEMDSASEVEKRANKGEAQAQYELGLYFLEEYLLSTDQDVGQLAFRWFQRASMQGHADAQFKMGECYQDSIGVPENLVIAAEWYVAAASQYYVSSNEQENVRERNVVALKDGMIEESACAFKRSLAHAKKFHS